MKNIIRIMAVIFALVLAFALAACGSGDQKEADGTAGAVPADTAAIPDTG